MSAIITCEFSQNKAIWGYPLTKLAHIIPGGGLASFVIFANCRVTHCGKIPYKANNPLESRFACHKVGKQPIHFPQVDKPMQAVMCHLPCTPEFL